MRSDVVKTVTYTLILDEEEAYWLKCTMQNPLHGQKPEEESQQDEDMRQMFFNAVEGAS